MENKIKVHVVTHTHWDREWYLSFELFRTRLLTLLDDLKRNMEGHSTFKFFSLDGQTVILEDYFELRPEKKEEILSLVKNKRVDVGPWYILPDEFLITGESFIRNYLIASDMLKKWGIEGMDIGYLPDMFGHSAYAPSILKGLGLKAAILWRGVGDASRETEFIWKSPNGDEILTINLIHSYSNGAHFGKDIPEIKEIFKKEVDSLSKHITTKNLLIMNGTDHEFPMYELTDYFSEWEKDLGNIEFVHSKFSQYIEDVVSERPILGEVVGELKSPKYEFVLKDVTSTRIYIKTANFFAQKLLTRYVEPLSTYLTFLGKKPDFERIEYAWKLILKSHPHDSICGCSIDPVHRDVETRLRSAKEVGLSLLAEELKSLSEYLDIDYEKGIPVLVFNPYEYERDANVSLFLPIDSDISYEILDNGGRVCESYLDDSNSLDFSQDMGVLTFLTRYKDAISPMLSDASFYKRLVFHAKALPPFGFKLFYLKQHEGEKPVDNDSASLDFENEFYKFSLNRDGSFNLKDKINNILYENLNYFEDVGDGGDEYNFSWIPGDIPINSLKDNAKSVKVKDYGFKKIITIQKEMSLPISLTEDRKARSQEIHKVPIEITYKLSKYLPRVDVELALTNTVKDHKLSFVVEIPEELSEVLNDSYFGIVSHPSDFRVYEDNYTEEDISRYAMETFAFVNEKKAKLSVVTEGIHEYESHIVDGKTRLTFTLLRAVGWLSRGDLTTRKGDAGPSIPTPEAQCIGTYKYKYAFLLLEEGSEKEVYRKTRDYLYEPVGIGVLEKSEKIDSCDFPVFKFEEGIVFSTLKVSRDKNSIVLRTYNRDENERKVEIDCNTSLSLWDANMKETKLKRVRNDTHHTISILPFEIKTVILEKIKGEGE